MYVIYFNRKETNVEDARKFVEDQKTLFKPNTIIYLPSDEPGMTICKVPD